MLLSIVIPCYNSSHMLRKVVELCRDEVRALPDMELEMILVNDCSPDDTYGEICRLAGEYPFVKGVNLAKNFGQHNAIMAGLNFASAVVAKFVHNNIKNIKLTDYQLVALYNSLDISSLKENFPDFKQNGTKFIAFSSGVRKAMQEAGLNYTITGPTKELPSMANAIEKLINEPNFVQTELPQEPVLRHLLHFLVGVPYIPVKILDRRRHIAGNDLRRVVIQSDQRCPVRIQRMPESHIPDHAQGVRDHRDIQRVLAQRFLARISHQRPALDVFHSRQRGKKVICHGISSFFYNRDI